MLRAQCLHPWRALHICTLQSPEPRKFKGVLRIAGLLPIFGLRCDKTSTCHPAQTVPSQGASWATSSHTRSRGNEILGVT